MNTLRGLCHKVSSCLAFFMPGLLPVMEEIRNCLGNKTENILTSAKILWQNTCIKKNQVRGIPRMMKRFSILAAALAAVMLVTAVPLHGFAAPASASPAITAPKPLDAASPELPH